MEEISLFKENLNPWVWNVVLFLVVFLLGLVLKGIIISALKVSKNTYDHYLIDSIKRHLNPALTYFLPVVFLLIFSGSFSLPKDVMQTFKDILSVFVILLFSWTLIRVVRVFEDYVVNTYDLSKEDNFRERKIRTQLQYLRRLVIIGILIVAISMILLRFESVKQIGTGLLTSAGVAGIIIGFAAQRSLANLFAGFQIAFTQPIRIDDVLIVENEWGRVEEITLTYVVVRIWDQRRLILPINYFIEKPFQNWTRISADIWGTVFIYTDYTLPIEPVRQELTRLLQKNELWDGKINVLQVTDSKSDSMELRALMSARSSPDAFDLRCYVRENLISFIQKKYPECLPRTRAELNRLEVPKK